VIHLLLKGWVVGNVQAELDRERPVIEYCNDVR
jgi:hypothetical protein